MSDNYLFTGMYRRAGHLITPVLEQHALHGGLPSEPGATARIMAILDAAVFPGLQQHTMVGLSVECIDVSSGCRTLTVGPADEDSTLGLQRAWAPVDLAVRGPLVPDWILRDHRDAVIEAATRLVTGWRSRGAPPLEFSIVEPRRRVVRLTAALQTGLRGREYIEVRPAPRDQDNEPSIYPGDHL